MTRALCLAVALSIGVTDSSLLAQVPVVSDSAVLVARRQLDAIRTGDYLSAARVTDPAELRRTRVSFDGLLAADTTNYIAQRLFRLKSTEELKLLSDEAFTAGLMAFQLGISRRPEYYQSLRGVDVSGSVPVGRDTVLVVYQWRLPPDSIPIRGFNVATVIRCPRGWCVAMAGDYSNLVRLLKEPMVRMPVQVQVRP